MTRPAPAPQTEIELKFLVPEASQAALTAAIAHRASSLQHISLAAAYLDTPDRRLARAGLAWRLRKEGPRWVQTLKAAGATALERFEHEVDRPDASHDARAHAGTVPGERLLAVLHKARREGLEPTVRYRTEVQRTVRRLRTRGAVVEIAWDQGQLVAAAAAQPIREIEFELVSGSPLALLAVAERWRQRFELQFDPRSKAERGDRLADGHPHPPVRKAARPDYPAGAPAREALVAVLDECLAQIAHNAIGLIEGDPGLRVEHVHQLRVGIRRLRCALRSFRGWVPPAPPGLEAGLKSWFAALGTCRDADVLGQDIVSALTGAGAPAAILASAPSGGDAAAICRSESAQATLLACIQWQMMLATSPEEPPAPEIRTPADPAVAASAPPPAPATPPPALSVLADRRLRRWHRRLEADWQAFDTLDEPALHALRKRIKRQRYAVEFFAPALRRRRLDDYLQALAKVQQRLGDLNDLFVARAHFRHLQEAHPEAWFALGWLAARLEVAKAQVRPALGRLAAMKPPRA